MAKASFRELLAQRSWLLADGATGTNLFQMGLQSGDAPEFWNFSEPEKIRTLHRGFVEAGADIILTNTFGANRYRLMLHNGQDQVGEINREAARLARLEADAVARPVIVAGSMGPTGEIYAPVGTLSHKDGAQAFAEQALALEQGGVDVLWMETISSAEEARAAIEGAAQTDLPLVITMSFDTNGRTMMGLTPDGFAELSGELAQTPAAIGANCGTGASELVATILGMTEKHPGLVVVAKGNCGIPAYVDGEIQYDGTPELMADYARLALDAGAKIIGGCCGTSSAHLAAMRRSLEGYERSARPGVADIEARLGAVSELAKGVDTTAGAGARRTKRRRARA